VQFDVAVPKPSGELVAAGALLSRNDFESLLDSATAIDDPVNGTTTSTTLPAP
jgi:hypothetical protein